MIKPLFRNLLDHAGHLVCVWAGALTLLGTAIGCQPRPERSFGAGWPQVTGLYPEHLDLDTTRVLPLPEVEGAEILRTVVLIEFRNSVTDSAKAAFFEREGLTVLGYQPVRRLYFVRIADPGTLERFQRLVLRLHVQEEVLSVAPLLHQGPLKNLGILAPTSWPRFTGITPQNLDTTRLVTLADRDSGRIYRTDFTIVFHDAVADSAKAVFFAREKLMLLAVSATGGAYYVRMPDPGTTIAAYDAAIARLAALPQVRYLFPIVHHIPVNRIRPAGKLAPSETFSYDPAILDSTKLAVIPGPENGTIYRTVVQISFWERTSDSARAAFFEREGLTVLGYDGRRGMFFVRIPDPGPSVDALYAEAKRLNELPEVQYALLMIRDGMRAVVD